MLQAQSIRHGSESRVSRVSGVAMNTALMFSSKNDRWRTPATTYRELAREFRFVLDAAAERNNRLCPAWLGPGHPERWRRNALVVDWLEAVRMAAPRGSVAVWLNPPYSQSEAFVEKAAIERARGVTTVMLLPARTDTDWWHAHIWDRTRGRFRAGVEVRFQKGRLQFLDQYGQVTVDKKGRPTGAPFPSIEVVFRGNQSACR